MVCSSEALTLQFEVRVNGVLCRAIRFRASDDDADDFDIMLDDQLLGALAITTDCSLQIREALREWRTVRLDELKHMVVKDTEVLMVDDLPRISEAFQRSLFSRVDDIGIQIRRRPSIAWQL